MLENAAQTWRKKQLIRAEVASAIGEYNLSETAEDIYIFAAASKANISNIRQHSYFANKSHSTIKRAVIELKTHNLLKSVEDTIDRRVQWLIPTD